LKQDEGLARFGASVQKKPKAQIESALEPKIVLTCNYSPWSAYSGGGQKSTHMLASALGELLPGRVQVVYTQGFTERIPIPDGLNYHVRLAPFWALMPRMNSPLRALNPLTLHWALKDLPPGSILHSQGEEASMMDRRTDCYWVHTNRMPDFPKGLESMDLKRSSPSVWHWLRYSKYAHVQRCLLRSQVLCATSQFSQSQIQKMFGRRAQVVPNGVDPEFFAGAWQAQAQGIVFFGRLVKSKGIEELIHAYGALPESLRTKHPLTFVGSGRDLDALKMWIQEQGEALGAQVQIIPWLQNSDLRQRIQSSALVVLPSHDESFGNTMLETLASGAPLLTCPVGSLPEVLQDQVLWTPAHDRAALAQKMQDFLENPHWDSQAKRQWVAERYSWKSVALAYLQIYRQAGADWIPEF
jgi:glycosyltransferase involved in cell wall biosynthesis